MKTSQKIPQKVKAPSAVRSRVAAAPAPEIEEVADTSRRWYIALLVFGAVLLAACCIVAFSGVMPGWEQRIFNIVNGMNAPAWLASQIASPISDAVWGIVILVVILLVVPKFRLRAWQYAVAAGSAYALTFIIEHAINRARPIELGGEIVLRASQSGPGFTSGHVAVLTAIGLTIWPLVSWPWRILMVCFVLAEGWSRVFLGVHAPLDVVGGVAVGAIVVAVIHLLPIKIRTFFKLN